MLRPTRSAPSPRSYGERERAEFAAPPVLYFHNDCALARRGSRTHHRRLRAGGAARGIGRRHGGDARARSARRPTAASRRAADLEPAGRLAHRRRLIGSDVLARRKDWKVVDNPFGHDDPIVLLPAVKPDVALFHAPLADGDGNVWIGRDRELATMAHAAAKTVVTVEKLYEGNLFDDPSLAAGAFGGFYVHAIALAPQGAWPLGLADHYGADAAHLADYARMTASSEGFAAYLDRHVYAQRPR